MIKTKQTYHKYSIVEQQKVYKAEIERIWKNQFRSLSARKFTELGKLLEEEKKRREEEQNPSESIAASAPNSPPPQGNILLIY
jgi:hypothetical protein